MFRKAKLITPLVLLLVLVLLIQAAPALAAGISVIPSSGSYGTTFTLFGDGFSSGENVSVSVLAPNNSLVLSGTLTADSQGRIQVSAQIPSGYPVGKYTVITQGQSSHRQYSTSFVVTGSTIPPTNAGIFVSPSSGDYTTTFVLTARGFNPGEAVSVWVVAPNNSTIGPQTIQADGNGTLQVAGQIPYGFPAGTYTAYAQGQSSGRRYSTTFTLNVTPPSSFPDWKGEYFSNQTLSGSPVLVRDDTAINFNWGLGSPAPSIPSDHFSVRWTRSQYFAAGTYTFTATTDDGMRVWVGNTLLIDEWFDQGATTYTANITLSSGTYPLRVEYYEDTGFAVAQVSWTTASAGQQPWTGSYYNNMTLSGSPVFVRQDAALNFDWGGGSPGPGVPGTNWSAKWDSTQYSSYSGNYTVSVTADDGVRVWVDGNLVIDEWHDQSPTYYSATGYLNAGWHNVHVEYYQHIGGSVLQLQFAAAP